MNPDMVIIHQGNYHEFLSPVVDGENKARGLVPRNLKLNPHGSMPEAPGFSVPAIPQSEWSGRIAEKTKSGTLLSDVVKRHAIPPQDQNGKGYCWAHSVTGACRTNRALNNLPFVELSAYSVACIIKGYRDEGGWCGESLKFLTENGVAPADKWPLRSMSRSNDNPDTREAMKLYKVTEGFYDLGAPIWSQKLTFEQAITCLLLSMPCAFDFNWWGHSVEGLDAVDGSMQRTITRGESGKLLDLPTFDAVWAMNDPMTAGIGVQIYNSWGPTWSAGGMGILTGNQAKPDGAVCIRVAA